MNRVLKIFGGVFLFILVAVGGLSGYGWVRGGTLDAESKAYVMATLPRILPDLGAANFVSFMAPEDRAKLNPAATDEFALKVRESLGGFQSFEEPKGDSFQMYSTGGAKITAKYLARCHFEKGVITATITLRKTDESWSLMGVHLDSNTLERTAPKTDSASADPAPTPAATQVLQATLARRMASRFAP